MDPSFSPIKTTTELIGVELLDEQYDDVSVEEKLHPIFETNGKPLIVEEKDEYDRTVRKISIRRGISIAEGPKRYKETPGFEFEEHAYDDQKRQEKVHIHFIPVDDLPYDSNEDVWNDREKLVKFMRYRGIPMYTSTEVRDEKGNVRERKVRKMRDINTLYIDTINIAKDLNRFFEVVLNDNKDETSHSYDERIEDELQQWEEYREVYEFSGGISIRRRYDEQAGLREYQVQNGNVSVQSQLKGEGMSLRVNSDHGDIHILQESDRFISSLNITYSEPGSSKSGFTILGIVFDEATSSIKVSFTYNEIQGYLENRRAERVEVDDGKKTITSLRYVPVLPQKRR